MTSNIFKQLAWHHFLRGWVDFSELVTRESYNLFKQRQNITIALLIIACHLCALEARIEMRDSIVLCWASRIGVSCGTCFLLDLKAANGGIWRTRTVLSPEHPHHGWVCPWVLYIQNEEDCTTQSATCRGGYQNSLIGIAFASYGEGQGQTVMILGVWLWCCVFGRIILCLSPLRCCVLSRTSSNHVYMASMVKNCVTMRYRRGRDSRGKSRGKGSPETLQ